MTELHTLSLIERAMRADSQPPHNAASNPPVPPLSQGEREYLECIAALRQRVVAAGRVA